MTDAVATALIMGGFGTLTTAVGVAGRIITRKVDGAAKISQANHEKLVEVQQQTNGNVTRLQELWAEEARRRESEAWAAAFEAGRLAEMTKNRRKTDALPRPETANDEEPRE